MIAVGIALSACHGCLRPASSPVTPSSPAKETARSALRDYAEAVAKSFDEAAEELDDGDLKSAVEANRQLQQANSAARKQAFSQVDRLLNDELGGDRWDAGKAGRLFRELAAGLRSRP